MPKVPSPSQEVIQSIDERPGNVNIGRITLVSTAPKNSNKPKFKSNGNRSPAKKKIVNNIVSKSFNTNDPVESLTINSGPNLNKAKTQNTAPIILAINQMELGLNNVFKNSFFTINFGLKILVITLTIAEVQIAIVIIKVNESPRDLAKNFDNIATGIVISPLKLIGIINRSTPIKDGRIKNNDDFNENPSLVKFFIPISFISKKLIFIHRILF